MTEAAEKSISSDLSANLGYRLSGLFGAGLLRLLGSTWQIDWLDAAGRPSSPPGKRPVIFSFWHGKLLPLAYTHRSLGVVVLVSRHGDGEYISQIICRLGYGVVRGSSTRGGLRALMEMARAGREGHPLAVTPDGPRGPRRDLQPGVLHIAQRSGLGIVPLGLESVRRTELDSWDRFMIPHPWSRVAVVAGEEIRIPPSVPPDELEPEWGPRVRGAILRCEGVASAWRADRTGAR